jgi:3-deoxy-D-manno-octulosonate 8-phosphate phosphatase (KDO 8-P phosphatase)
MTEELLNKLKKIKCFVLDVDGVFTDCTLTVGDQEVTRTYNVRDGYGVNIALKAGYKMAIISGGKQENIKKRLGGLGVKDIYLSVDTDQKPKVFKDYLAQENLKEDEIVYMGDDIPDLLLMQQFQVLSACPADAVAEVRAHADFVTKTVGGRGCVRELIEAVMKAQGIWLTVF